MVFHRFTEDGTVYGLWLKVYLGRCWQGSGNRKGRSDDLSVGAEHRLIRFLFTQLVGFRFRPALLGKALETKRVAAPRLSVRAVGQRRPRAS